VNALRIALLDHTQSAYSRELASGLRAAGHEPRLLAPASKPAVEALLRRRGFTPALSHVPRAVAELMRGEFDLAHAFSAPDAAAALAWRGMRARPAVFTLTEPVDRAAVADGRLRVWTLARAIEESDALVAATDAIGASIERWFACSPAVIGAGDAARHERRYRELLTQRRS
jgi:hypothetical protein